MVNGIERAKQYRHRAEELRSFADDMHTLDAREAMWRTADSYDQMAAHVELESLTAPKFDPSFLR